MSKINRSEFIRNIFSKNKKTKYKDVVSAWEEAEYPIEQMPSRSLFYFEKNKSRYRPKKKVANTSNINKKSKYIDIEKQLDNICMLASNLKDLNVLEEIRKTRRLTSKKILSI